MIRSSATLAVFLLLVAGCLPACDRSGASSGPTAERPNGGWDEPPRALSVETRHGALILSGQGPAAGRVLLRPRGGDPAAFTIGADGRFAHPLAVPEKPTLYRLELDRPSAPHPGETLALLPSGHGVVLASGSASRALSAAQGVTTVDYDGAELIVAGRVSPGARVDVAADGRPRANGRADAAGRFVLALGSASEGPIHLALFIEGAPSDALSLTLVNPGSGDLAARPAGEGFGLIWPTPGGGGQLTWFRTQKD